MQTVTVVAAVSAGLIGGVFFAFSAFVMPALRAAACGPGHRRHAIHQSPRGDRAADARPVRHGRMSVVAVIWAIRFRGHAAAPWMLAGGAAYIVAILITIAGNVPLNNALAGLDPASAGGPAQWLQFVQRWTLWNHLRGASSVAASAAFILALIRR